MPTTQVSPLPKLRFVDNTNAPLAGGKLFTYAAGTTTKLNTFTDQTGNTQNANPVILDTRGEANVWLAPATLYKFVLAPSTDSDPPTNAFYTVDNLSSGISIPVSPAQGGSSLFFGGATAGSANAQTLVSVTPSNFTLTTGYRVSFTAGLSNTAAMTLNVNATGAVSIKKRTNAGLADPVANDIVVNQAYTVEYDGTQYQLLDNAPIIGTAANNLVQLNGSAQLPAVDGSLLTSMGQLIGAARNLKVVQASATTATVTADEIICETALGGTQIKVTSLNVTLNIGTTGANGMDTGSASASADLSLYAIAGPGKTNAVLAVLGATSNGEIYSGTHMPTGYTASALIGSYKMNGSAQFNAFTQMDRVVNIPQVNVLTGGNATSITSVSISSAVPANAKTATGFATCAAGNQINIYGDSAGSGVVQANGGGASVTTSTYFSVLMKTAQTIFYSVNAGSGGLAAISGYAF